MTEDELELFRSADSWQSSGKPHQMVWSLQRLVGCSERKWRLMGAAFARTCETEFADDGVLPVLLVCDQRAEGKVPTEVIRGAVQWLAHFNRRPDATSRQGHCVDTVSGVLTMQHGEWSKRGIAHILQVHRTRESRAALCDLLRDIFGNPFRPVAFDPRWRSESAVALARTAYDTRNFSLLPILADALEDAGCDSADVLNHLRQPDAVHVRGCWAVDAVLGLG